MGGNVIDNIIFGINIINGAFVSVLIFMMLLFILWCVITNQPFRLSLRGFWTNAASMSHPFRGTNAFRSRAQYNYLRRAWPRKYVEFKNTFV